MNSQPSLFGDAPATCRGCGIELTRVVDISFSQCFTCNHEETEEQLLGELRRWWRDAPTQKRRLLCAAWAARIKGDDGKVAEILPRWKAAR